MYSIDLLDVSVRRPCEECGHRAVVCVHVASEYMYLCKDCLRELIEDLTCALTED